MKHNSIKRVALFGATGSIGRQTLDVMDRLDGYEIVVLSAGNHWEDLARLALKYSPELVTIANPDHYSDLKGALSGTGIRIEAGSDAAATAADEIDYDLCLNGLVGVAGLLPSYYALKRGIDLALANKESLVLAGDLLNRIAQKTNAQIIPVDSEHCAIHQCIKGEHCAEIKRLILTASGGPFRDWSIERILNASPDEALNHPTWKMGPKITIDSATLMNKGMEIIEAYHLFGLPVDRIIARIHPVSVVHSFVEFVDGFIKAQLGVPDMRLPIQYALTYPERVDLNVIDDDPADWAPLEFFRVDTERYPCLELAYQALRDGGTATAVLNGADEMAVERFLNGEIGFGEIAVVIKEALDAHTPHPIDTVQQVIDADDWGRRFVAEL
ncbi:MAG: 1-deoxy-D-xylulose-5-phosphate reductoisomerase [Candidatus Electryoneaceae bacterium]|nr:1-deoxy-D-xylulose-5-phosphate reductoisomerase [Candidatus Electryoneaceae bacterium]